MFLVFGSTLVWTARSFISEKSFRMSSVRPTAKNLTLIQFPHEERPAQRFSWMSGLLLPPFWNMIVHISFSCWNGSFVHVNDFLLFFLCDGPFLFSCLPVKKHNSGTRSSSPSGILIFCPGWEWRNTHHKQNKKQQVEASCEIPFSTYDLFQSTDQKGLVHIFDSLIIDLKDQGGIVVNTCDCRIRVQRSTPSNEILVCHIERLTLSTDLTIQAALAFVVSSAWSNPNPISSCKMISIINISNLIFIINYLFVGSEIYLHTSL